MPGQTVPAPRATRKTAGFQPHWPDDHSSGFARLDGVDDRPPPAPGSTSPDSTRLSVACLRSPVLQLDAQARERATIETTNFPPAACEERGPDTGASQPVEGLRWQACDGPNGAHFCGETPQSAFPARATAGRRQNASFSQRSANSATHFHPQRDESAVFFLGGGILGGPRPVRDANPGSPALRVGNPRRGVTRPFRPGPRRTSSVNTAAPRTRSSPENPRGHSPQETSALAIENEPLRTIPAGDFYHRLDAISASPKPEQPPPTQSLQGIYTIAWNEYRRPPTRTTPARTIPAGDFYHRLDVLSASPNNNEPGSHNPCRGFLSSPGRVIGVPQQQRARVAQSLQGISTIAWGCHSAAPATPGCRAPNSTQLCRSCLPGTGRGPLQRRGLVEHHKQTIGKVGNRTDDSSFSAMRFARHHAGPVETPCCDITRNVTPLCRQLLQS
jgi:hypothetical protein